MSSDKGGFCVWSCCNYELYTENGSCLFYYKKYNVRFMIDFSHVVQSCDTVEKVLSC